MLQNFIHQRQYKRKNLREARLAMTGLTCVASSLLEGTQLNTQSLNR